MTSKRSKKLIFQIDFLDSNLVLFDQKRPTEVKKSKICKVKGQGHQTKSQTVFSKFLKIGDYKSIFLDESQDIYSSKGSTHISN